MEQELPQGLGDHVEYIDEILATDGWHGFGDVFYTKYKDQGWKTFREVIGRKAGPRQYIKVDLADVDR